MCVYVWNVSPGGERRTAAVLYTKYGKEGAVALVTLLTDQWMQLRQIHYGPHDVATSDRQDHTAANEA